MSQYFPAGKALGNSVLNRKIDRGEYNTLVEEMEKLGFYKGWIQDLQSHGHYRPDFGSDMPFGVE